MALFSRLFHPTTRHPRREERQGRGAWVPVDVGSVSLDVLCFLKRKGKRCLTQHGRSWHRSNTSRCLKLQPFENGPSVFLDRVSVRRLIDDSHCRVRGESLGGGGARLIDLSSAYQELGRMTAMASGKASRKTVSLGTCFPLIRIC